MIYIETNEKNELTFMHYMPFDAKHGMNKSAEELELTGFLIDELPVTEEKAGYSSVIKFDKESKIFSVEYVEIPKTETEILHELIQKQQQDIAELTAIINKNTAQ